MSLVGIRSAMRVEIGAKVALAPDFHSGAGGLVYIHVAFEFPSVSIPIIIAQDDSIPGKFGWLCKFAESSRRILNSNLYVEIVTKW